MKISFEIDENQLPAGWIVVEVKQIAEIVRGVTYEKSDARAVPGAGYMPVLRATNIQDSSLVLYKDLVFVPTANVSKAQLLRSGDIVVATSSGSKHLVGKTAQVKTDWNGSFGAFCAAIRPVVGIKPRYFGYFLESPAYKSFIAAKAMGVNINNLRRGDLEEIRVPIAPLNEQTRIVAEIEKQFSRLDEAVANLKRVKANLKRYKVTVLKAAVEGKLTKEWRQLHPDIEPADKLLERILAERRKGGGKGKYKEAAVPDTANLPELPVEWVWASLESVANVIDPNPSHRMPKYCGKGIPFISSENFVGDEDIDFTIGKQVDEKIFSDQRARFQVEAGDFVLTRIGTIGKTRFLPQGLSYCLSHALAVIKSYTHEVDSKFLRYVVASDAILSQAKEGVQSVGVPDLGMGKIRSFCVPLMSTHEQREIVKLIEERLTIIKVIDGQVQAGIKRAERLRQSILKQAFSGQLVPQHLSDEPASVLLERIWANASVGADCVRPDRDTRKAGASVAPLRKPRPQIEPASAVSDKFACLDDVSTAILGLMQPGREYARVELADPLGLSTGRWNATIQELKRVGKVRQVGEKRGARYHLL